MQKTLPNQKSSILGLRWLGTALVAVSLILPAVANAQSTPMSAGHGSMMKPSTMSTDMSGMDMRKSMEGMNEAMKSMPMSGNPDVDFAMMMRAHHQGAIDMAQVELNTGKDPAMRNAAKKIIAAQKKEIAEFDRWLAKHKQ